MMNPNIGLHILLIDDEESFRDVIARSLVKHGFKVWQSADGKGGLRRAAENHPDLILCDLNMPEMNGYEVLARLRGDERLADIPIIFLTAQSEPAEVRQGMNLGADDYLIKPANIVDLLGAIQARLKRRQSERQRQEKQMERAMRLFGETVHDLRNPLAAVFGYTSLLKNATANSDGSQEKADRAFAGLQKAVARTQDIISETMFVVRSQMKRLPLNPVAFDLREFFGLLLADYEPDGRLQFRCGEGRFPVVADGPRLRHAIENLLSNGLKYSDGAVVVCLTKAAEGYHIEVSDRGVGIPIKDQASIFEPFFRASNTAEKAGHGLGLCVSKSCIQEHGGSIRFVSEPNEGTTFSINLPASPPGANLRHGEIEEVRVPAEHLRETVGSVGVASDSPLPMRDMKMTLAAGFPHPKPSEPELQKTRLGTNLPRSRQEEANPDTGAKMRAIVIEDDPVLRHVLCELLQSSNSVNILGAAGTVAEARLLARQQKPAVVFLDVNLPDGSGFDLLPGLEPNVSVVFVTSAEEYAAQAFDCEATDYLVKPVTSERLQKALLRVRQRLAAKTAGLTGTNTLSDSFLVKTLTEKRLVKFSDVKSILAYGEYSWVYWDKHMKGALLRKSLKKWQSELPRDQFIRVHRRAIVNLAFLDRVQRLPAGRLQIHLRDVLDPILVSLSQTPVVNRMLKALRV